jgi:Mrp family chromosome partitioning ATPase
MERIKAAINKAKGARAGEGPQTVRGPAVPTLGSPDAMPAAWAALERRTLSDSALQRARIVTHHKENVAHVAFDILRTKLLKTMERNGWNSIAITSPSQSCGKTMIAANLAFSFARQGGVRVVLCDVDLKRPSVRKVLGVSAKSSMGDFLSGVGGVADHFERYTDTLAIGVTGTSMRHSAEVVQNRQAFDAIADMKQQLRPNVIIYDLPPMMASDDAISFMAHVDCVLLIAAAGTTTLREIDDCESQLSDLTNVIGVVLNKYDVESDRYYEYDYN